MTLASSSKVLIVDDEPLARERLAQLLGEIDQTEAIGGAANGKQAIEQVAALNPDIVLMDIRMPLMDGLEAAHHLQTLDAPPAVIFCTAYDEHALAAFDASAVDYIVKPVRRERLAQALEKAQRSKPAATIQPDRRGHLCANHRGKLELIPIDQVLCLVAEHKYVTVLHSTGEVLIEESLRSLEAEFDEDFLRVHRNALVGVAHISALSKDAEGRPVIQLHGTDRELEVSRRNLAGVRKALKQL